MVYVIQEPVGKNINPASEFGEIKYLLRGDSQILFSAGFVTNSMKSQLSNFNDNDYLLLIGDPVAIGIATAIACQWNQGRAKLLKWDRQESKYYPIQIDTYQKGIKDGLN